MGTYTTNTRTVLNATLTNASTYSSGPLDVGDLYELAIDCHVTSVTNTSGDPLYLAFRRIGTDGHAYYIGATNNFDPVLAYPHDESQSMGPGMYNTSSFGDQFQIDLVAPSGASITATLSIKGK